MEPQESPLATTSHLLQLAGWPVCVGAGGVGAALEVALAVLDDVEMLIPCPALWTQYAWPSQKLVVQSVETAGFHA